MHCKGNLKERKRQSSEWENKCLQQMFKLMNSSPNMQTAHAAHDKAAKKNINKNKNKNKTHPINPIEKPQRSKWMCLQGRHPDGHKTHEKMLRITFREI